MPNDQDTLYDIIIACRRVIAYVDGKTLPALHQDDMLQDALIRRFEIIGEATKRLSLAFRHANADAPWQLMAGMRDRLIHGYDKVDLVRVWAAATESVPQVLPVLERIFESMPTP